MKVDENMKPVPGTEERIECDGLILSVGLIPENELAESLDVPIDERTRGPVCDQEYMSEVEGIFCAGNALHVNDLVAVSYTHLAKVLLIERERKLGGILKQCIHDGFGLMTFGERLSGPEYSERFIDKVLASDIEKKLLTFVTKIKKVKNEFVIYYVNREGAGHIRTKAIVLATGCRERTAKQVFIHGTRPSGIYTAGTAQY